VQNSKKEKYFLGIFFPVCILTPFYAMKNFLHQDVRVSDERGGQRKNPYDPALGVTAKGHRSREGGRGDFEYVQRAAKGRRPRVRTHSRDFALS
jgi:hypothetical protein